MPGRSPYLLPMLNTDTSNLDSTSFTTNPSPSIQSAMTSPPSVGAATICNNSISPSSTTPRRIVKAKRSLVWRYFNAVKDEAYNVECTLCSSVILRRSTSTSNLLHHMQTQHNSDYQHINKSMKSQALTSESSGRLPLTSDRSIHLTKLIADLIVHNFLPLSIVESSQFQSILHEAEPSYVVPKRKYFINNVLKDMYGQVRDKVHQELQQTVGNLCSTHLDIHILCL